MRVLVTGVAGFIGSSLALRLLQLGHEVVGIDSVTDYYDPELKWLNLTKLTGHSSFTFVHADLNSADVVSLLQGVGVVYHQAGQPGVRKSWGTDFLQYTLENVNATQRLLEAARTASTVERIVYASSSSIYGDAERYPTREVDRPLPLSPYGVTKLAAEHLCSLYAKSFGLPTVSLRYFTVYGPGQRPDMAFTRFVKASIRDEEITIFGAGEQIRDFTYIDDVVNANVLAGFGDVQPGTILNVAGGSSATVNEVLGVVQGLSASKLRISHSAALAGDAARTGGDTSLIREVLGWSPTVALEDGLARQYRWGLGVFGDADHFSVKTAAQEVTSVGQH